VKRLAIVGLGLIGGSIGLCAKQLGIFTDVVGVEASSEARSKAVALGAVDRATESLADGVQGADIIVLAVPVPIIRELLPQLPALLSPTALVTDVGSIKGKIATEGTMYLGERFLPGHPMAGSERHGILASRADLFQGATWVITPLDATSPYLPELIGFVETLGAIPLVLSPDTHDAYVAITSHVPHVVAYALYARANEHPQDSPLWKLAAGGFHSTTRVAASSPEMWTGICLSNRENIVRELEALHHNISRAITALETDDSDALLALFREGHRQ
jgi:prephenate dehydrogenase